MKRNLLSKIGLCVLSLCLAACGESGSEQSYKDHLDRAQVYQEQGQYKAAVIEYKNATNKSQGDAKPFIEYAGMLNELGQYSSALNLLEATETRAKLSSDDEYLLKIAKIKTLQGLRKFVSAEAVIKTLDISEPKVSLLKANNLLGLGQLDDALKVFNQTINDAQFGSEAKLGKATALARKGLLVESETLLKTIPDGAPDKIEADVLYAELQLEKQDLEGAEETLSSVLSRMPNTDIVVPTRAIVLERLAYVLTRLGRSNEAYIYTKILAEAFPGSSEIKEKYQSAVNKLSKNDAAGAKVILDEILKDYPHYNPAKELLGVVAYLEGDNETAAQFLNDSVDPEIANDLTRHIYAATNYKLNSPAKVLEILDQSSAPITSPQTLALYGMAAISDKQYAKGEKALLEALEQDKSNTRIRLLLAELYRSKAYLNEEQEKYHLNQAYKDNPTDFQTLRQLASYRMRVGGVSELEKFVSSALERHPKALATNLVAGYFYMTQNQARKALDLFENAVEAETGGPYLAMALAAKGNTELSLRKYSSAEKTFSQMVVGFSEDARAYKGLYSAYVLQNKEQEGRKELESLGHKYKSLLPYSVLVRSAIGNNDIESAKKHLDNAKAVSNDEQGVQDMYNAIRYFEALEALSKRDFDYARSIVADILNSEPNNLRLLSFLVDLELKAGQLNEAEKVLEQVVAIDESLSLLPILRGDIAAAKQDIIGARKFYREAWELEPTDIAADKLYRILGVLKNRSEQKQFLTEWLKVRPGSTKALLFSAMAAQSENDLTKAKSEYEKVLETSPSNVLVLNNLGWIYFELGDFERSLPLLERAYKLAPQAAAVVDSYGWVLFKSGDKGKGLELLKQAHELAPDNDEIKQHLETAKAGA